MLPPPSGGGSIFHVAAAGHKIGVVSLPDPRPPAVPSGVGGTALGVARMRAAESRRPDRLFDDPFASAFAEAGPARPEPADHPVSERAYQADRDLVSALTFSVVIRTRFFDDYLTAAAAQGCAQVVLVAAGLDTRAFRLDWPADLRLYELDQPEVLQFKHSVLGGVGAGPRCQRRTIPVDLRRDWPAPLTAAGFDPGQPTAWLVEGLLIYLSPAEAAALLTRIGALSPPGSRLALERGGSAQKLISQARGTPRGDRLAAMWKGGLGEDAAAWLTTRGWQATAHDLAAVARTYGRPAPAHTHTGFATATRPA
jgi:methyltransferase (TIGR00027 family)